MYSSTTSAADLLIFFPFPAAFPSFPTSRRLRKNRMVTPTATATAPTGAKEKNPRGSRPSLTIASWMTRFGGVLMRVKSPILLANAIGIRYLLALMPEADAILITIGIITATVPVLLTNAPIAAVTSITRRKRTFSLLPPTFIILPLIILARPVLKMPAPTTKSPTIIMTTELENPERASSGVSTPVSRSTSIEPRATMSDRILPLTNNIHDRARTMRVTVDGDNIDIRLCFLQN